MAKDMVVVGADNCGDCTLGSNQCNLANVASVTGCNTNGVFTCPESDCYFRVGAKLFFEADGSNPVICGVIVGRSYFVLESSGSSFKVSACAPLSGTSDNKACFQESNLYTPATADTGLMVASSHSGEGGAFIFERNLPHVTNHYVYASMSDSAPPAATFSDQDCVPQYVAVVVISSLTSDDTFTISTNPEKFGCANCIATTANFVVGAPVFFSAVSFFGGVVAIGGGQEVFPGYFIVGMTYTIKTAGSSPQFIAIGASDNNIGTTFIATGTGSAQMGTGSAVQVPYQINSQQSVTKFSIQKIGSTKADLVDGTGIMTATTSIAQCVPVKNVWGFRRQLIAPEEDSQFIQANVPINKQGDRFGTVIHFM